MRANGRRSVVTILALLTAARLPAQQPERLDYQMLGRIREEGMQRSQVMDIISWLADVKGPRLTGSPGFKAAGDWTIETLKKWGISNVHYEPWAFGRSWSLERFSAHMIEPQIQPLIGYPKAWSPGTNGVVQGDVVQVLINSPADFEKYRGKLRGKIVLPQTERAVRMLEGNIVLKMGEKEIKEAESTPIPAAGGSGPRFPTPAVPVAQLNKFYLDEGVVAVLVGDHVVQPLAVLLGDARALGTAFWRVRCGVEHGLDGRPSGVGDRTRGQAGDDVGVVRRCAHQIRRADATVRALDAVEHRGIGLQRHAALQTVLEHGRDRRALGRDRRLLLDDRRRSQRMGDAGAGVASM